ncbi:pectinesterase inhibitor 9-like [Wolffia australiana]
MERMIVALAAMMAVAGLAGAAETDMEFVRASCRSTRYPALCEHSLGGYAGAVHSSPRRLAITALAVSAAQARSCSVHVGRLAAAQHRARSREAGVVRDCIENVGDSVDRLRRSVAELGRMGKPGGAQFAWRLSNVQTWVSAALTDETTCLDGLAGPDVAMRAAVRPQILLLAQETSNALALVNRIPGAS